MRARQLAASAGNRAVRWCKRWVSCSLTLMIVSKQTTAGGKGQQTVITAHRKHELRVQTWPLILFRSLQHDIISYALKKCLATAALLAQQPRAIVCPVMAALTEHVPHVRPRAEPDGTTSLPAPDARGSDAVCRPTVAGMRYCCLVGTATGRWCRHWLVCCWCNRCAAFLAKIKRPHCPVAKLHTHGNTTRIACCPSPVLLVCFLQTLCRAPSGGGPSDLGLNVKVLPRGRRVVADGAEELLDVRLIRLRRDGARSLHQFWHSTYQWALTWSRQHQGRGQAQLEQDLEVMPASMQL